MGYYNPYNSFNFKVVKHGSYNRVYNRAGIIKYGSGYSDVAINEAIDSLRNARLNPEVNKEHVKETVKFGEPQTPLKKEHHSITATVGLAGLTKIDATQAKFTLGANIDAMFEGDNFEVDRDQHIHFEGGLLYGDKGSRTKGSAFRGSFHKCAFRFVEIYGFKDYGTVQKGSAANACNTTLWDCCWFGGGVPASFPGNAQGGLLVQPVGAKGSSDCHVRGGYFINNGDFAIKFDGAACAEWKFTAGIHFTCWGEEGDPQKGKGIVFNDFAKHMQIVGNHFEASRLQAILAQPANGKYIDNLTIVGNEFDDCSKDANNNTNGVIKLDGSLGGHLRAFAIGNNTFFSQDANRPLYAIYIINANCELGAVGFNAFINSHRTSHISSSGAASCDIDHNPHSP